MSGPAAFRAGYADWKLVKTRGVVQIVFEVPLAEADLAYKVVGGMPNAAAESWFGIAKLRDTNAADQTAAGEAELQPSAWDGSASPSKQRRPVAPEKRLAQQAGICCADPLFQKFMLECRHVYTAHTDEVTQAVRTLCHVASRSEIVPETPAGDTWEKLHAQFLGWRDHDLPAGVA